MRDNASSQKPSMPTQWVLVATLLVLAILTRFWEIGAESLWFDEYTMIDVTDSWEDAASTLETGRAPVMVALGYIWGQVFGYSDESVRALPAVAGTLTVVVFYLLAVRLFDPRVALPAALLMIFSGFAIYHSQDYRYYSVFLLFTVVTYWFLVLALQKNDPRYFIPFTFFGILIYYTHLYGLFVYFGLGAFFLLSVWRYPRLRLAWFASLLAIGLAALPHVVRYILGADGMAAPEFIENRMTTPIHTTVKFLVFDMDYFQPAIIGVTVAILGAGVLWSLVQGRFAERIRASLVDTQRLWQKQRDSLLLTVTWFIFPIFTPFILSYVMDPMYQHRYVYAAFPPLLLLIVLFFTAIQRLLPVIASVGAILFLMIAGLVTVYYPEAMKEEWEAAFETIQQFETQGDVLVLDTYHHDPPSLLIFEQAHERYYEGDLPVCTVYESLLLTEEAAADELATCLEPYAGSWFLIRAYGEATERIEALSANLAEMGLVLESDQQFYGMHVLYFVREE